MKIFLANFAKRTALTVAILGTWMPSFGVCSETTPLMDFDKAQEFLIHPREVSPQAVWQMGTYTSTHRILDSRTSLDFDIANKKVFLHKFGTRTELTSALGSPYIAARNSSFVVLRDVSQEDLPIEIIHVPTGKLSAFRVARSTQIEMKQIGDAILVTSPDRFILGNGATGEYLEIPRTDLQIDTSTDENYRNHLVLFREARKLVFIEEGKAFRTVAVPADANWDYCSGGFYGSFCSDSKSKEIIYFLTRRSEPLRLKGIFLTGINPEGTQAFALDWDSAEGANWLEKDPQVIDLISGIRQPLKIRSATRNANLSLVIFQSEERLSLVLSNYEVWQIPEAKFWELLKHRDLDRLLDASQLAARGKSREDMEDLSGNVSGDTDWDHPDPRWNYSEHEKTNDLTFWRVDAPQKIWRTHLPNQAKLKLLGSSNYLQISFHEGGRNSIFLLDLSTRQVFDLGMGSESHLSADGRSLVVYGGTGEVVYWLPALHAKEDWRRGPIETIARPELSDEILNSCEDPHLTVEEQPLAARLITKRNIFSTTDEHELREVLAYRLNRGETLLLAHVLQRMIVYNPEKALLIFRKYDLLKLFLPLVKTITPNPCMEDDQTKASFKYTLENMFRKQEEPAQGTNLYSIQHLAILYPYMERLGLNTLANRDQLSENLAQGAARHYAFHDIFFSKLNYLTDAVVAPLFGEPPQFKVDVTDRPTLKGAEIILLSTVPTIDERVDSSAFGIYHRPLAYVNIDGPPGTKAQRNYAWRANGKRFEAKVELKKTGNLADLMPKSESFDYSVWQIQKQVVGMMIIGTNFSFDQSEGSMLNYRDYYETRGYKFAKATMADNFISTFLSMTTSGTIDYLIKEAHSDGDEKNLFRASNKVILSVGQKTLKTGFKEIIYLVEPQKPAPPAKNFDGELISNQRFGEALRARRKPLLYVNGSCTSAYKVRREFTAAATRNFVPIASLNSVWTFASSESNPTAILVSGILDRKPWKAIRTAIDKVRETKANKYADFYVFPNDDEYDRYIRKYVGISLDSKVKLIDMSTGKELNIDQQNHH